MALRLPHLRPPRRPRVPPDPSGDGATFAWLATGACALAAMLAASEAAARSIRLETYIYADDAVGQRFRDALVRARERGARVRVLVDSVGSIALPARFWEPLTQAGGEVRWFNPLSLRRWPYRDHRKLLVCDEAIAFIGGCNIAAEYDGDGVTRGWRDLGLRIDGPLAQELAGGFDDIYARADLRHRRFQRLRRGALALAGGARGRVLAWGPGRRSAELKRTLRRDLGTARSVRIVSGYFLPPRWLRRALRRVVRRGGRVQLILAGKTDIPLSRQASRYLYARFLRAGVEIYEYQPQVLHAKMIVIDDCIYAGSANLDARSLQINYELLLRVEDAAVAAEARAIFDGDLARCQSIERRAWAHTQPLWARLQNAWAHFLLARVDPWFARRQLRYLR